MSAATDSAHMRIVIAGGGLAGLSLALALKQALSDGIDVVMCDPALQRDPDGDKRSYAIAAAARRMLGALGIWDQVADKAQPMLDMVITDSRLQDPVRPTFLTFAGEVDGNEPFAHMVTAGDLTATLLKACREAGVDLRPEGVKGFAVQGVRTDVILAGGEMLSAALLVAADGARSACASRRVSAGSPGRTNNPASSRPSAMSAITRAGRWSISCPPAPSPSCRLKLRCRPMAA